MKNGISKLMRFFDGKIFAADEPMDSVWPVKLPALLGNTQAIAPPPRLVFDFKVFRQLDYYFTTQSQEFQAMGLVERTKNNLFWVKELVLNKHTAGLAHANIDEDKFPELLDSLEREGKDITKLRFQVHSHGESFKAMFSSQDLYTIKNAYVCDWIISFLGNTSRDYVARLDIFEPIQLSIALPIMIAMPEVHPETKSGWDKALSDCMNG